MESVRKVLLLGSGAIKVAEAAEFDYSGSQAIKALKEEGIEVILVNPNVATIQTGDLADEVYLLPIRKDFLARVIDEERPDGIMLGFGGQTALDAGIDLWRSGVLSRYGIKVLGTQPESIDRALNREKFKESVQRYGVPMPPSHHISSPSEALKAAESIGYPVIVRVSYNLGGKGSFVAWNEGEMRSLIQRALKFSSIGSALVEKYLGGWKEIEFEVVRDSYGNAVAPACLENADPMGIHTGESLVVAPCQTLTNREYQLIRSSSLRVAEAIGLVGEGNVQFALNKMNHYAIEMNPRMSRSSALASKATGYPLAYVAAKLALGYRLDEIVNKVTGTTCSCFEPSLDYIVVKVPRWDLEKFERGERRIGSEMKSIGEVMAIGRNFAEAVQKSMRMLGLFDGLPMEGNVDEALKSLKEKRPYWPAWASIALSGGVDADYISELSGIDIWFIRELEKAVKAWLDLKMDPRSIYIAKRYGFSDSQIAKKLGLNEGQVRNIRLSYRIGPSFKQIDTLAAEWPSVTNYLYATYGGVKNDIRPGARIIVIGAGVFRIGVSVEFDWSVVEFARASKGYVDSVAIVNYNPETVSTDWDTVDRLYFEELTLERLLDIYEFERPDGVIAFLGGQIANDLANSLEMEGVNLLGTSGRSIEIAESREKFSELLDDLKIEQPPWIEARSIREAVNFAEEVGYPLMIRPSHVLSGTSMFIVSDDSSLRSALSRALSTGRSVVISKFIEGVEAEIDGVGDGESAVGVAIKHVEPAGIHSGDSTMVLPAKGIPSEKMKSIALKLVKALDIRGPFNLQFVLDGERTYVLELNLRASRSMPFSSKSSGINLAKASAKVIFEGSLGLNGFYEPSMSHFSVKSPQFSWSQLKGSYPYLGVEMRSTGEAASLDRTYEGALLKSWLAIQPNRIPRRGVVIGNEGSDEDSAKLNEAMEFIRSLGLRAWRVSDIGQDEAYRLIRNGKADIVMATGYAPDIDYKVRRIAADLSIPLILDASLSLEISKAITSVDLSSVDVRPIKAYARGYRIPGLLREIA